MRAFYFAAACTMLISGCNTQSNKTEQTASQNDTITIKGSDTELMMVQHLANEYMKLHPETKIKVTGGGTGRGIESFINNQVQIATASREIEKAETSTAIGNGVKPKAVIFAVDALAIITNSKLGVDSLSTVQLAKIFSGEITNWKEVGGPDLGIHLYGRDSTSGTYTYFKEKFIEHGYSHHMKHLDGNAAIVKAVREDLAGIGYSGLGYLMDPDGKPNGEIWAMPIHLEGLKSYSPYEISAVKKGDYVLTRPLYQYINEDQKDTRIYDFLLYELQLSGQETVRKFGYFPINDYQKHINSINGF
jgi:phosphate transport system substrate-binding protein